MKVEFATSAIRKDIVQHEKECCLTHRFLKAKMWHLQSLGKYVFPKSDEAIVLMTVGKIKRWLQKGYYIPDCMEEIYLHFKGQGDDNLKTHYRELVRFGIAHPDRKDVQKWIRVAQPCLATLSRKRA